MSPRKRRPENRGLPARWTLHHGAYYYCVPPGQEHRWDGKKRFRLGSTLPEAYRVWADRMERPDAIRTVGDLLDRYLLEVSPTKVRPEADSAAAKRLKSVFGHMPVAALRPTHAYGYHERRAAKTAAKRELAVLSHALTKAVQWGVIDRNPWKGQVRIANNPPRDRHVTDAELAQAAQLASSVLRTYIALKVITGLRRGDLLALRQADLTDEGIDVRTSKTGRRLLIEWTPALRAAVDQVLAVRPKDIAPTLFCTRNGKPYSATSFNSIWQRFMRKCVEAGIERFHEHDLRAVAAGSVTLEHAQQLLGHSNPSITARVYRRGPQRVKPAK